MRLLVTGASGFIGTHVVRVARERGHELLNIDIKAPRDVTHAEHWQQLDIMHADTLKRTAQQFRPDAVLHLAARTDCDENTTVEEGYQVNTTGTSNVLEAVRATSSVKHLIITSTQYVFNKGAEMPRHDEDYHPVTVYGQSKVVSEQLTRSASLACKWTIVRPTNVWGPWHLGQRDNFFYALQKGFYVHPGSGRVVRSYGYVGNVVHQMLALIDAPAASVDKHVLYVGDEPIELIEWVNAFSKHLKGRPVRVVPEPVVRALGKVGDGISRITKRPFLITSTRFHSMTQPYVAPMAKTFEVLGPPPFTLQQGVEETSTWLRQDSRAND